MAYKWDSSLETGNRIIDNQHKQLFEALDNLVEAYKSGRNPDELKKTMGFLTNYVVKHFSDEEKIQETYAYPDIMNHKRIHSEFKNEVARLAKDLEIDGYSDKLFTEVIHIMSDWVVNHIKSDDFKLAAHIKSVEKSA